jgi:hypothetical protein
MWGYVVVAFALEAGLAPVMMEDHACCDRSTLRSYRYASRGGSQPLLISFVSIA